VAFGFSQCPCVDLEVAAVLTLCIAVTIRSYL
jgi:hypothetical protein